jgi:hypothetical protein
VDDTEPQALRRQPIALLECDLTEDEWIHALILVTAVGLGAFPGVLAIALHATRMLGRARRCTDRSKDSVTKNAGIRWTWAIALSSSFSNCAPMGTALRLRSSAASAYMLDHHDSRMSGPAAAKEAK